MLGGRLVVAGDGKQVVQWVARGTHEGRLPALDVEPTGQPVEFRGVTVSELDGEKMTEAWWYYDTPGVFGQMGLIPEEFTA